MNNAQKAIIAKDIKELVSSKQTLLPMIIVPMVMVIILPLILVIGAGYGVSGINGMDLMIKNLSGIISYETNAQLLIELGLNFMFPAFFLLIPIMAASIMGASCFVGEKEHKTLETLLYSPMQIKEIFAAKVIGTAIPSILLTILSAIAFGIIANIGGLLYFDRLIFPNVKWLILIVWVSPAVTLLSVSFMVLFSAKANTFQEAQQVSAFIIIPVLLLIVGQATGLFLLNEWLLLAIGAVIFVADFFLVQNAARKFVPEKLI